MKVTKVAKTRIAVSRRMNHEDRRAVLYPTPNESKSCTSVKEKIGERVSNANKLYGVFFKSDIPFELEKHFNELVKLAIQSRNSMVFCEKAKKYKGYDEYRNGKTYSKMIGKFTYGPAGKNLRKVMELHVRERMADEWQEIPYRNAAVEILLCICDKDYQTQILNVEDKIIATFFNACQRCSQPYIEFTRDLEDAFSDIMKQIASYPKNNVSNKIWWLQNKLYTVTLSKKRTVELGKFSYEYATEDRMRAILVRMRKSLKRGTNADIAVALLKGIAQMNGQTLSGVLTELCANSDTKENLKKFIQAVDADYHKTPVLKAIRNHDVKVQTHDSILDLSSINIEKVSEKKKYKVALSATLERYAASPESSVQTLTELKGILFDYFLWNDSEAKEEFLAQERLWKIPNRTEEYFDSNFVPVDDKKNDKIEAIEDLASIWRQERVKNSAIKARINYVNCGKYQQLIKDETDDFRICWISYAKDFVEKNYVRKQRELVQEDCFATRMLLECWKDVIRFICGKYIDLGKAVYHFAMPEQLVSNNHVVYGVINEKYRDGISSFDYEAIKAEENIQRDIANATVAAVNTFSRSVIDSHKQQKLMEQEGKHLEDVLFLKEYELLECVKEDDTIVRDVLRYYGGYSSIDGRETLSGVQLAKEILVQLKAIRNENFHFTQGKHVDVEKDIPCTMMLWENERRIYKQTIKEKYYSNNVAMFYSQKDIQNLVANLYRDNDISEAQIPAFRTIWKKKELPEYINGLDIPWDKNESVHIIYEGTLYFLLKEIYYCDFVKSANAKRLFLEAIKDNAEKTEANSRADIYNREKKTLANAGKNFKEYVDRLKIGEATLGTLCQFIQSEYNQQNRGKQEVEIYKHFKMLLPLCMRLAFQSYIEQKYAFLKRPMKLEQTTETYLDQVEVACMDIKKEWGRWFTFAHFIHPRQLNLLVGNFKDYIQYREDVLRRTGYAGQFLDEDEGIKERRLVEQTVEKAKNILEVLEFVRNISGRVSNEFTDYYSDRASYETYIAQYFASDVQMEKYDLYADAKNVKILRNMELARMFAGSDLTLGSYPKITNKEIQKYYAEKDIVAQIQSQGICRSHEEQERVVAFQKLKGRITLNEMTDLFSLVNDLLGKLVSLAYLRERDEMYLFLGFYYMALRNKEGWQQEVIDTLSTGKYVVDGGLALYQTVALFDFGTKLLCQNDEGKWEEATGMKWSKFIKNHKESYECIIPLFEVSKYSDEAREIRNYVDHSKYYINADKSILELYSKYYTHVFSYSNKLRKSVLENLTNILEKYGICAEIQFNGTTVQLSNNKTKSTEYTYKYEEYNTNTSKKNLKTVNLPAKSKEFVTTVCQLLGLCR